MLKNLIAIALSLGLSFSLVGCSLFSSDDEKASAETEAIGAEEMIEGADGGDPFASDFAQDGAAADLGADDLAPSETLPEDDFGFDETIPEAGDPFAEVPAEGSDPLAEVPAEGSDPFAEPSVGEDAFADEFASDDAFSEAPVGESDPFAEPSADPLAADPLAAEPMTESPTFETPSEDLGYMGGDTLLGDSGSMEEAEQSWVPVKKIADQPFEKNGVLVNAVYLVREGDTLASISRKIYGADRTDDLLKVNPTFRNTTLDVGEKVYYNSPNRPEDNTSLKTFYEDMGLAPEIYITAEGDNIREVAKNLLGHPAGWKEIWATNPNIESKGAVDAGIQLKYWMNGEVAAPSMAASEPPPSDTMNEPEPPSAPEPPPMPDMAANEPPSMPEEPESPPQEEMESPDMAANGAMGDSSMESLPPPPPPPPPAQARIEPPPPPPPPSMARKRDQPEPSTVGGISAQDEQTLALGIGAGLLLAAIILFIIIRKKRARRQIDFNTATQTQIE